MCMCARTFKQIVSHEPVIKPKPKPKPISHLVNVGGLNVVPPLAHLEEEVDHGLLVLWAPLGERGGVEGGRVQAPGVEAVHDLRKKHEKRLFSVKKIAGKCWGLYIF